MDGGHLPTEQEVRLLELTGLLWDALKELEQQHPEERQDLRFHVHAIQDVIAARPAYRFLKGMSK